LTSSIFAERFGDGDASQIGLELDEVISICFSPLALCASCRLLKYNCCFKVPTYWFGFCRQVMNRSIYYHVGGTGTTSESYTYIRNVQAFGRPVAWYKSCFSFAYHVFYLWLDCTFRPPTKSMHTRQVTHMTRQHVLPCRQWLTCHRSICGMAC
jgi:hypothetical protein